jgi:GTP:adenosylcobinamide-phosphate guanylyltransferase
MGEKMSQVDAIVLAGGKNSPEMIAATGVENRALLELEPGRTMLSYIVEALEKSEQVRAVYIVGDVPPIGSAVIVSPGESLLDNLLKGIEAASTDSSIPVLTATSDAPFINTSAVDDFLSAALAVNADFCYPIIPMDAYVGEFAGAKRTTLKLKDGCFTGGNLMLIRPERMIQNKAAITSAYKARKDVLALGKMLGLGFLVKIIVSQTISPNFLTVAELEAGIARLLGDGATAKAIITTHPSIGADVDKPSDVEFARQYFKSRISSH